MASDVENKKWLDDYMSLKQVNPNNPFTVPDGYFNELGERVVSAIHLNEIKNAAPASGFTVPENYFDELSNNILGRINIEQTVNTADAGFSVPENYFEQLSTQIQSRVFVEEALAETSEALTVPDGYFDKLNKSILNKTVNQDMVRRKSGFIRSMYNSPAFKYATAACFVAIVGAGIFFRPSTDAVAQHKRSFLHKQLSTIPDSEMESYLKMYADANEAQHIMGAEGITVDDAKLESDLENYADTNQ